MKWADLLEPNIKISREGFRVGKNLAKRLVQNQELITKSPEFRKIFTRNGRILKEGDMMFRKNYAKTLEELAIDGDVKSFYKGRIGKRIVEFLKSKGGILEMEDLKDYTVVSNTSKVLHETFRHYDLYSVPLPASGNVVFTILNILEQANDINYHQVIESLKFGYGIRLQMGDPTFNSNLSNWIKDTMSKEYASKLMTKIDMVFENNDTKNDTNQCIK